MKDKASRVEVVEAVAAAFASEGRVLPLRQWATHTGRRSPCVHVCTLDLNAFMYFAKRGPHEFEVGMTYGDPIDETIEDSRLRHGKSFAHVRVPESSGADAVVSALLDKLNNDGHFRPRARLDPPE